MAFSEMIKELPATKPLDVSTCRTAVLALQEDLNWTIVAQEEMNKRVVQAALLNSHALIESLPGQGKTKCVQTFANVSGMKFKRIQYIPDMIPSDIIGKVMFDQKTKDEFKWFPGPIFNSVIVADEINRAPPKVQAATLECMQERTCTRIDQPGPETVYHSDCRADLLSLQGKQCFGIDIPHPDDKDRVPFVVFATQNPIEMEGTYPLSEAQTDRFMFKLLPHPPLPNAFSDIIDRNLPSLDKEPRVKTLPWGDKPSRQDKDGYPFWLKTACLLQWFRDEYINKADSMHRRLLNQPEHCGLWDRVRLIIALSHYRTLEAGFATAIDDDVMPAWLRNKFQEMIRSFLAGWYGSSTPADVVNDVKMMLTNRLFEYVEAGSSVRGLLDWPRAAIAEAFIEGSAELRRRHFRAVADDVLRHRIRLTPEARAEDIAPDHLIHLLVDTLLPLRDGDTERAEDRTPLIL